jgi:hypothetical protein
MSNQGYSLGHTSPLKLSGFDFALPLVNGA